MNKEKKPDIFKILLVEDNAADILLLQEALEDIDLLNINLYVVNNGEEAMSYLQQVGAYAAAERPDIILLDLNLPKLNGFSVLLEMKRDLKLQEIPVIVLSTSNALEDVKKSYQLHANCFVSKPSDLEQFMGKIKEIVQFWHDTVSLP